MNKNLEFIYIKYLHRSNTFTAFYYHFNLVLTIVVVISRTNKIKIVIDDHIQLILEEEQISIKLLDCKISIHRSFRIPSIIRAVIYLLALTYFRMSKRREKKKTFAVCYSSSE